MTRRPPAIERLVARCDRKGGKAAGWRVNVATKAANFYAADGAGRCTDDRRHHGPTNPLAPLR